MERDDARRGVGLLLAEFERGLVGHAARVGDEAVLHARTARGLVGEKLAELDGICVELQVALHNEVAERSADRGLDQLGITMAEHVHADTVDQVPLHASIDKLDERTISDARAEVRIERPAPAHFSRALEPAIERLLEFSTCRPRTGQLALLRLDLVANRADGCIDRGA